MKGSTSRCVRYLHTCGEEKKTDEYRQTLLYMLIQRAGTGTRLPPGFTSPPWHLLASQWSSAPVPHTLSTVLGPSAVVLGHCDSEADDHSLQMEEEHIFGWDNENPRREVWVDKFRVEWRPVSNCEYLKFWEEREGREMPKSWVVADCGEIKVGYPPCTPIQ